MAARLRVFVIGVTADDLASLAARVEANTGVEVAGQALLRDVQNGRAVVPADVDAVVTSPQAVSRDREQYAARREPLVERLTPRERAVLALVADGLPNREIAREMEISEHTVKFHLAAVFGKLGVSSRTEAVRRGLALGLIEI